MFACLNSYLRGKRFGYTYYYPSPPPAQGIKLSRTTPRSIMAGLSTFPIHESITALDKEAMDILTILPQENEDADVGDAHEKFATYLARTKNTICGRHPIGVLLGALKVMNKSNEQGGMGKRVTMKWVKYDHSSECETLEDSSVSYASAFVKF